MSEIDDLYRECQERVDSLEDEINIEQEAIEGIKVQIAEKEVWEAKARAAIRHKNRNRQLITREISEIKRETRRRAALLVQNSKGVE